MKEYQALKLTDKQFELILSMHNALQEISIQHTHEIMLELEIFSNSKKIHQKKPAIDPIDKL